METNKRSDCTILLRVKEIQAPRSRVILLVTKLWHAPQRYRTVSLWNICLIKLEILLSAPSTALRAVEGAYDQWTVEPVVLECFPVFYNLNALRHKPA